MNVTGTRLLSYGSLVIQVTYRLAAPDSWTRSRLLPREVRLIVLHSAECVEVATAAESLASWSAGPQHPRASWHFAVDSDSITQSVDQDNVAWHAGTVNGYSIGIEQAGRAAQTSAQWADEYSRKMLENTARLLAVLAGQYDMPLEHVTDNLATAKGICTHADVTRCFRIKNGHWDPGPNYPIESVLARARALQLEAVT